MTQFKKADFEFDGMYLMYAGDQGVLTQTYGEVYGVERCHPSRVDMIRPMFIARFKYGSKPWKTWVNILCKNYTVEQVAAAYEEGVSPLELVEAAGYKARVKPKHSNLYCRPLTALTPAN